MHVQQGGRKGAGSQVCWGGFVSYISLWYDSTDFHTHCETATKLEKGTDKRQEWKDVFLRGFPLCISPPLSFSLCLFLLSLRLCFSVAAH